MANNNHHFSVEDAIEHGIEKAILLQNLRFWLDHAKANNRNVYDGYHWIYNSAEAFAKLFPYMSSKKIAKLLKELEIEGIIKTGHYNKSAYDRTKWYTMSGYSISQIREMDFSEEENQFLKSEQPIPDINTDIISDTNHSSSVDDVSAFEKFWNAGMRKIGKKKTFALFKSKAKEMGIDASELANKLVDDVTARLQLKQYGFNALHPETYIRNERWEDEYVDNRNGVVYEKNKQSTKPISAVDRVRQANRERLSRQGEDGIIDIN